MSSQGGEGDQEEEYWGSDYSRGDDDEDEDEA